MNTVRFSVRRPVATSMVLLAALLLGSYFYVKVPATLLPEFDLKFLFVRVRHPGASAEDMARLVTEPLESFFGLVHGLEEVRSTTTDQQVRFMLKLHDSVDIDLARIEVFEKIEAAQLPPRAEAAVYRFDPTEIPVIALDVFGGNDQVEVQHFAQEILAPRIERVPGVGKVEFRANREPEIRISISDRELVKNRMSLGDVHRAILAENISPIGGRLREGRRELLVRAVGRLRTVEDFRQLLLQRPLGPPLLLGEVATIEETLSPVTSLYHFNDEPAIMLRVKRKASANTLEVCRQVKETITATELAYGKGVKTDIYHDSSEMIERELSRLADDLKAGAVVAAVVLAIFLLSLRSSLIILATVPVCIMATFVPMYLVGTTVNLLSLMGFALVAGMLVDNAIIILESVFRHAGKGAAPRDAAESGALEVRGAVAASTFTTVAVFVPVFFVGGQATMIFRDLAFTSILALGTSLVVAFLLVPLAASRLLGRGAVSNRLLTAVVGGSGMERLGAGISRLFVAVSSWSQRRWWRRILLIAAVAVGLKAGAALTPPDDAAQIEESGCFRVSLDSGAGTSVRRSDGIVRDIEGYLRANFPRVEDISAWAEKGGGGLFVELRDRKEMAQLGDEFQTADEIQEKLVQAYRWMPGVRVSTAGHSPVNPEGRQLELQVVGQHFDQLRPIALEAKRALLAVDGIYQVETDFDVGGDEVRVTVDRARAADLGLTSEQVAAAVGESLAGGVAFTVPRHGGTIDVRVTRPASEPLDATGLARLGIISSGGQRVPLEQLAEVTVHPTTPTLRRRDGEFTADLTIRCREELSVGELRQTLMNAERSGVLDRVVLPPGYRFSWGGAVRGMIEQQQEMQLFLVAAIGLVFLIMAALFESLLQPLIVMFTLPLAYVGAGIGARAMGVTMNEMANMGIIILLGIVVNNAIVLVDYVNLQRRRGVDRSTAISEAVRVRMRPIFMTTLTTVGALLPLLFGIGEGSDYNRPMAAVVVSGLSFSTVLTLLFLPAFYSLVEDIRNLLGLVWLRLRMQLKRCG